MGIAADGGAHEAVGGIQTAAGLIGVEVAGDHDDGGLGVPVGGNQGGGGTTEEHRVGKESSGRSRTRWSP